MHERQVNRKLLITWLICMTVLWLLMYFVFMLLPQTISMAACSGMFALWYAPVWWLSWQNRMTARKVAVCLAITIAPTLVMTCFSLLGFFYSPLHLSPDLDSSLVIELIASPILDVMRLMIPLFICSRVVNIYLCCDEQRVCFRPVSMKAIFVWTAIYAVYFALSSIAINHRRIGFNIVQLPELTHLVWLLANAVSLCFTSALWAAICWQYATGRTRRVFDIVFCYAVITTLVSTSLYRITQPEIAQALDSVGTEFSVSPIAATFLNCIVTGLAAWLSIAVTVKYGYRLIRATQTATENNTDRQRSSLDWSLE